VAVIALAATIQATGRGSGVIVSKTNVLNQEFSTAQAIWPVRARAAITIQARGLIELSVVFFIVFLQEDVLIISI
jgi:hypothetical protein